MNVKAACLSALLVIGVSSMAAAGPVADAAMRAEELQAQGKTVEALEALDEAIDRIWTEAPLAFRKVALIESEGPAADAAERSDHTFRPDDKLRVRVEPVGYAASSAGSNAKIAFKIDLLVENDTGQVFSDEKDVFTVESEGSAGRRYFSMTLAFGVPYVRPGEYKATFNVRDQNSSKSGSFEVPFTVAAPTAETSPAAQVGSAPETPAPQ